MVCDRKHAWVMVPCMWWVVIWRQIIRRSFQGEELSIQKVEANDNEFGSLTGHMWVVQCLPLIGPCSAEIWVVSVLSDVAWMVHLYMGDTPFGYSNVISFPAKKRGSKGESAKKNSHIPVCNAYSIINFCFF